MINQDFGWQPAGRLTKVSTSVQLRDQLAPSSLKLWDFKSEIHNEIHNEIFTEITTEI